MKDKKGQVLVGFVILLPVLLIFCVFVIDIAFVINKNVVVKGIIDVKEDLISNKQKLAMNEIEYSELYNKDNCVFVRTRVKSLFGKILKNTEYEILVKKC